VTGRVTAVSADLALLRQTLEALERLYDRCKGRDPSDAEDKMLTQLEATREALEHQIKRAVQEQLGVDYAQLWALVQG
jgi:DNA-binding GntR family transcriptional regulator